MTDAAMPQVLLARQPILDQQLKLFAYELLFRRADSAVANVLDGDTATSEVVLNAVTGITPDTLRTAVPAFVNMTESMLISGKAPPVPPGWVVLEVLETVEPSPRVIESLTTLKLLGYRLALDDFVYTPAHVPLIKLADFVKIDIRAHTQAELEQQVQALKPYSARLLAEKIETHDELEFCRQLGFSLFQGYFLHRPEIVHGKKVSANLQLVMTILSTLQREDVNAQTIADLVNQDARLSYQLLRIINSAAFSRPRAVNSVREAVVLLGIRLLRNWISLIAMANAHTKPPELMTTLLVRARMAENIATAQKTATDSAFTVGLFSGLDALFDLPMAQLLQQLPLRDEIKTALLEHRGALGEMLTTILRYERGEFAELDSEGVDLHVYQRAYIESLVWTRSALASMS